MNGLLLTVLLTILALANFFFLGLIVWFLRRAKDKASKIGFGFIVLLIIADMIAIYGGVL